MTFQLEASEQYQTVNFPLAGLQTNQTYHYRLVAENYAGTNYGSDVSFYTNESIQNTYWIQTAGPNGGYVVRLTAIDNALFAGVGGAIYISDNQALSWNKSNEIFGYDFAKNTQGILYAASRGVYRSTDNGASWYMIGLEDKVVPSIAINSNNNIFVGTVGDGIYRSTDNGNSWEQVYSGNQNIYSLRIDNLGNIFGGTLNTDVKMIKSTDNGSTWEPLNPRYSYIWNIFITPSNQIYIATSFGIDYSIDGGVNWNELTNFNVGGANDVLVVGSSIYAVSASTGNKGLYKSTDNGLTWNAFNNGLLSNQFTSLCKDNSNNIYCGSVTDGVYKLSNSSNQWIRMYDGIRATNINLITHTSTGLLLAGRTNTGLFKSTNNGVDWTELNNDLPQITEVRALGVADNDYIYISIRGAGLFRSTDFGNTWSPINPNQYAYTSGLYVNGNQIYCYAVEGTNFTKKLLYSNNYGIIWAQYPFYGSSIEKITGNSLNEIFAMGSLGDTLYKSSNNGETWNIIPSDISTSNKNCIYADENYFYLGVDGNGLFRTNDNGLTWETFNNGLELPINVRDIYKNSWGELLIATSKGFYKFNNSSKLWKKNEDGLTTESLECIDINSDGIIYLGTTGSGVFKSQYSTANPYQIIQPNGGEKLTPGSIYSIVWQSNGMNSSKLEFSTDNGNSWISIIDTISANTDNFVWAIPNTSSIACKIRISSNTNASYYDISDESFKIEQITNVNERNKTYTYSLSQNYPNPFNPSTTIKFSVAEPSQVTLKIYDILGSEVMTVINERLVSGEYSFNVNLSTFASGIYFYRIQAGEFTATKKFILLK